LLATAFSDYRARRLFFSRCRRIFAFLRLGLENMNVPDP